MKAQTYNSMKMNGADVTINQLFFGNLLHLEAFLAQDLKVWLDDRASVIQSWIDAGKMKAVNPHHLIFLIWGSTQHYADFSTQVCWALGKKEYDQQDFQDATATVAMIEGAPQCISFTGRARKGSHLGSAFF